MNERISFYVSGSFGTPYVCYRSIQGNETLDETLDKLTVSFNGPNEPFEYGTKALLFWDNSNSGIPTYDASGKPLNHREYIVESGEVVMGASNTKHTYRLVEPTAVLKNIRMESLTFTSRSSITIKEWNGSAYVDVLYTKNPYNLYTVVYRILQTTRYKNTAENLSMIGKIRIVDAPLLRNTSVNVDDNFKENTLYDALFKLGKYFGGQGRVPVLYFSSTGSYEYDLYFERTDGMNLAQLDYATFTSNSRAIIKSTSNTQFADAVVSDTTNMVSFNKAQGVSQDWYGFPSYEDEVNAPTSNDKAILRLKHRITDVVRLRRINANYDTSAGYNCTFTTIPCVPFDEWNINADKGNMAYYREGESRIYFGSTLNSAIFNSNRENVVGTGIGAWLFYNVTYYPLIDTKITKSKGGVPVYETTFNQTDSYIDAGTYGNMIEQYLKTMGNAELTIAKLETGLETMAKLGQQVVDGTNIYYVTSISYKSHKDYFETIYQLNKGAIKRNDYVGASQRIRNVGIDYDNTEVRYTTIREKVLVQLMTSLPPTGPTYKYLKVKNTLFAGLFTNAQKELYRSELIQKAFVKATSSVIRNGTPYEYTQYLKMPFASTRVGNGIILNLTFETNKIAGYKMTYGSSKFQSPVYYSDPFAEVQKLSVGFGRWRNVNNLIATTDDSSLFNISASNFQDLADMAGAMPSSNSGEYAVHMPLSAVRFENLEWRKDGREVGNVSIQLDFLGSGSTEINNELVDKCGFLQRDNTTDDLYIIVLNPDKKLSQNDIILTADIYDFRLANTPDVTNRSLFIKYTTSSVLSAVNQTLAIAKLVETGIYKPLIYANNRTFTNQVNFYIAY